MIKEADTRAMDLFSSRLALKFADVEPPESLNPNRLDQILAAKKPTIHFRRTSVKILAAAAVLLLVAAGSLGWALPKLSAKNEAPATLDMIAESAPAENDTAEFEAGRQAEMSPFDGGEDTGGAGDATEPRQPGNIGVWVAAAGGCVLVAGFGAGMLLRLKRRQ